MELAEEESLEKVAVLCFSLSGSGVAFLMMPAECVCKIKKRKPCFFSPQGSRLASLRLAAGLFNSALSLGQKETSQSLSR